MKKEIIVTITEGIPYCTACSSKDCAHVGFKICAEQVHISAYEPNKKRKFRDPISL
jgi:hypothetical protein